MTVEPMSDAYFGKAVLVVIALWMAMMLVGITLCVIELARRKK